MPFYNNPIQIATFKLDNIILSCQDVYNSIWEYVTHTPSQITSHQAPNFIEIYDRDNQVGTLNQDGVCYSLTMDNYLGITIFESTRKEMGIGTGISAIGYVHCVSQRVQEEWDKFLPTMKKVLSDKFASIIKLLQNKQEKAVASLDAQKLQKLINLVSILDETEIDLAYAASVLIMTPMELTQKLLEWMPRGMRIKRNSIMIDKKDDFIEDLDRHFKAWSETTGKKS